MNRLLKIFLLANFGFMMAIIGGALINLFLVKQDMVDIFGIIINKPANYDVIMVKPDFYIAYVIYVVFFTAGVYSAMKKQNKN